MKTKFVFISMLVMLAMVVVACGKKPQVVAEKSPVVTGVQLETITASFVEDAYEATGTVRAKTSTVLSSKIMGTVISLRVREGDRVSAGQILIEIDNREAAAQLQKAQAGLRQAEQAVAEADQASNAAQSSKAAAEANKRLAAATLARYQTLLDRKSVSPQEFDEVRAKAQVAEAEADRAARMLDVLAAKKKQGQAQMDQAKADIASAQVFAGYARVVTPVSGIVTAKQIAVGATATPGAPLLTIEDAAHYRLEAAIEESQIGNIKLKDRARVKIDAIGGEEQDGTVAEILPAADPMSRSYTVKIDISSARPLRSGLYGTARFVRGQRQAITIPTKAVTQRGQLTGVFVVDDANVARLRLIKTGKNYGDRVEVLSGLNEHDRIAVDGAAKLNDGVKVQ
ncbi:MAG TPA: efflux RND transporter periplasmic adaptor subunit [Blastocatellia bacterium]|nr:efflux RND transporter periplasmic adaptor subunit [Blastocatellia bacterium]